jgi:hypothetical protein
MIHSLRRIPPRLDRAPPIGTASFTFNTQVPSEQLQFHRWRAAQPETRSERPSVKLDTGRLARPAPLAERPLGTQIAARAAAGRTPEMSHATMLAMRALDHFDVPDSRHVRLLDIDCAGVGLGDRPLREWRITF